MSATRQLDLANQVYAEGHWDTAALAYELYLRHYPRENQSAEVRLLLGLVYARHVPRPDRARELLSAAADTLRDDAQRGLAKKLLDDLEETN